MSSRLSSMLVQQRVIAVGELQDALALQVVRGGTLDTVLLERDLVPEATLIQLLSQISGYPPIEPETMDRSSPAAAGEIPEATARKLGICPVLRDDDRLLVVSSEATDKIALPELAYELNCVVIPTAATELRVQQAHSLVYGTELPARFADLLRRHGARPPRVRAISLAAAEPKVTNEGTQAACSGALAQDDEPGTAATAPPTAETTRPAPQASPIQSLGDAQADTALSDNATNDDHTTREGLNAPDGSMATAPDPARQAAGTPIAAAEPPSSADGGRQARQRRTPTDRFPFVVSNIPAAPIKTSTGPRPSADSDQSPSEAQDDTPPLALDAAIFELDRASDREEIFLTLVRAAHFHLSGVQLYGVIRGRLLTGRYALEHQKLDLAKIRQVRIPLNRKTQLARCVFDQTPYIGPTVDTDATATVLRRVGIKAPHVALIPIVLRNRTVALLVGHQDQHTVAHTLRTPLTRLASAAASALARLIVRRKQNTAEIEPHPSSAAPAIPALRRGPLRDDRPRQVSGEIGQVIRQQTAAKAPLTTVSRAAPDQKVIVDFDVSITTRPIVELVDDLDQHPELAVDVTAELRRRSRSAIEWLLENFPGKLRFNRSSASELPDVSQCSAVLQALVAIGRPVVARLAPLLVGGDEETRFFATYLLSELTYPETVSLLAKRLRDASLSVRQAAIYGLRRSRELDQFPLIVEELRADLSHPDTRPQLAAMEALAALGDVVATPSLIALLNDDRGNLAQTAHRSLVQLTKQDFGNRPQPWMTWWSRNRQRHRLEWMIDGLINDVAEIREQAFVELRDLTGLDFGYDPALPREQREEIRHRFLQWWTDTGIYDFSRYS